MILRDSHMELQSISVVSHVFFPFIAHFSNLLFLYPQLRSCVWLCTCQQGSTEHGELCLCLERSQRMNEHVCTCVYVDCEQCPLLHGKGEEEIFMLPSQQRVLSCVLVALAILLLRAAATSVAWTILKDCFVSLLAS